MCAQEDDRRRNRKESLIAEVFISSPSEFQLWSYALDLLDPEEQDRVMEMIARDPEAQRELGRIRDSIASASRHAATQSFLACARARAETLLKAMGQELSSIAAVLVPDEGKLAIAFENAAYSILGQAQPVMAGEEETSELRPGAARGKLSSRRIEIRSGADLKVSVVCVPDRGVDLHIETLEPTLEGRVILSRFVDDSRGPREEDTGIVVSLRGGKGRIEDCPSGLLRLIFPNGRDLSFYVSPELPQAGD